MIRFASSLLSQTIRARTNPRPLAIARMVAGITAMLASLEAWRVLAKMLRPLVVRMPVVAALPTLPARALPLLIAAWILAALLFTIGWKTRAAGCALVAIIGYTLFLDQQTYSNHFYLLFVVVLLLTIADSGAAVSLDARRRGAIQDVAAWPIVLLKIQLTIMYLFSALAKVTPDYLNGTILKGSLKDRGLLALPDAWRTATILTTLAVISILIELFVAFALWPRRTRLLAIAVGAGFHLLILCVVDSSRLSLTIFALSVFAIYVLFAGRDVNADALSSRADETGAPGSR